MFVMIAISGLAISVVRDISPKLSVPSSTIATSQSESRDKMVFGTPISLFKFPIVF